MTPNSLVLTDLDLTVRLQRAEACLQRLQALNPRVTVRAYSRAPCFHPDAGDFGGSDDADVDFDYDVVVDCRADAALASKFNFRSRAIGNARGRAIAFYVTAGFGYHGFMFADLGDNHEYVYEEKIRMYDAGKDKKYTEILKNKLEVQKYCIFNDVLKTDWTNKINKVQRNSKDIFLKIQTCLQFVSENKRRMRLESKDEDTTKIKRIYNEISEKFKIKKSDESFISKSFGELSPVSAIVGGITAQEIIKAITKKDHPLNNCFLFDGEKGIVDKIDTT